MYLFFLKIGAFLRDIIYYFKKGFMGIFKWIADFFCSVLDVFLEVLYRILKRLYGFTEIGFVIGIVFLIFNIRDCIGLKIQFNTTKHFVPMLWLMGVHVLVFIACKILSKHNL